MSNKWKAAGKILYGASSVVSGLATATGHGLIGTYMKNHGHLRQARQFGYASAKRGQKLFQEGMEDWKRSQ